MTQEGLSKLLNTAVKKRFPEPIDKIIVNEEDLGSNMYYIYVIVVLNKYDDIEYSDEIRKYIEDISEYMLKPMGNVINQIYFSTEN